MFPSEATFAVEKPLKEVAFVKHRFAQRVEVINRNTEFKEFFLMPRGFYFEFKN